MKSFEEIYHSIVKDNTLKFHNQYEKESIDTVFDFSDNDIEFKENGNGGISIVLSYNLHKSLVLLNKINEFRRFINKLQRKYIFCYIAEDMYISIKNEIIKELISYDIKYKILIKK